MELSDFGRKLSNDAGILQLMDDLGTAMAGGSLTAMFGGGNPAQIPEVSRYFRDRLSEIVNDPDLAAALLGNYDTPQGNAKFIDSFVTYLNQRYDFGITRDNVAITAGSQSGFFMLFNLLAGTHGDKARKILLPIVPEYIGYADQLIEEEGSHTLQPRIERIGEHEFKYHVDFDRLVIDDSIAAIALSRPTNPTGNVVTNSEIQRLSELARKRDIPLIIDNAYGLPFPGVIADHATPHFDDHTILSFSLSKLGLPSARVGIFVGPVKLMKALSSANAIVSLASPSYGQYLAEPLLASGEIDRLCRDYIQPYYAERAQKARALLNEQLPDDLPWRLHVYEGSYFFWLWCEGARKSAAEIYRYLKERGVIVVPGHYFFPGQDGNDWPHARECLRLNFARPDAELNAGVPVLAEMIRWAYE